MRTNKTTFCIISRATSPLRSSSFAFALTCQLLAFASTTSVNAFHLNPLLQTPTLSAFQHHQQPPHSRSLFRTATTTTFGPTPSLTSSPYRRQLTTSSTANNNNINIKENKEMTDPLDELNLPSPLILGSGSFTRKLILTEMNIPYKLLVRPIDEKNLGDRSGSPHDLVLLLAKAKSDYLVEGIMNESEETLILEEREEGWIVLTGDQVVTHENNILEKPESIEEAKEFVNGYAQSPPSTVGAVVLTHIPTKIQVSGVDSAQINFKPSVAECNLIEKLLEEKAPVLDCAGGLMVEHKLVREHVEGIDGTEDSVMGLSKDLVIRLLKELKDKLLDEKSSNDQ